MVWRVLSDVIFSRYIKPDSTVVDVGAGYCEFINAVCASKKYAVDLNPETVAHAASDVTVITGDCRRMTDFKENSVDIVFSSNFLEHLPSKQIITEMLSESQRILRKGGKIILMGPNIRFLADIYWDFYDHTIPLSDRSISEALLLTGFSIEKVVPKFLPYTTKTSMPINETFLRLYLCIPMLRMLFGKQFLIIGQKAC
ncbi:MAG: class I SAM-dependent methyltransferase [Spirochaetes bacterium]|nr:class I SAM-dependent methyltransferase [Spirochaetota bacterium]